MRQQDAGDPHLVILAPDALRGQRIKLAGEYMTVGREPGCDVVLDVPHVSRTHAALRWRGTTITVTDLGSSGGTFVNGVPATTTAELRAGDVVAFATVRARLEAAGQATDETAAMPSVPGQARYDIGRQDGQVISNVGHDQYNAHVQQVVQRRDSFLREIAATKTKARWLVRLGFILFVAGFALFAAADLNFLKQISNAVQTSNPSPPTTSPFGSDIGGVPSGLVGWAMAAAGVLMLFLGIVLHVVATSRRRQVERDFPLPPPWPYPGSPGHQGTPGTHGG